MRRLFIVRPGVSVATILGLVAIPILASGVWRQAALKQVPHPGQQNPGYSQKLKSGLGTKTRLAPDNASTDEVRASISSIDRFIAARSGLRMTEQIKARLTQMEGDTLGGAKDRIGIPEFVGALTDILVERMSNLTDDEFKEAADVFKSNGGISLRADGRFGMTQREFIAQATSLRERCRANDKAARAMVQAGLKLEVDNLIGELSDGLPSHFGRAATRGLTPAQAVIVTYSVITDDDLAFSTGALARSLLLSRNAPAGTPIPNCKVYGPSGQIFATPADLVLNESTMNHLLDRLAKGGN
jgi:hypothetical protein